MKLLLVLLGALLLSVPARAQPSIAQPVVPGYQTAPTSNSGVPTFTPFGQPGPAMSPSSVIPITASATGTTAATTATLAASTALKTWICGFSIGSTATAAAAANATVTGTVTGTLNFEMGTGTSPAVVQTVENFNPCIPSSAVNTGIAVVSAAPGSGGVISVTAWGYQQ